MSMPVNFERCIGFVWGVIVGMSLATGSVGYAAGCTAVCFVLAIMFPVKPRG